MRKFYFTPGPSEVYYTFESHLKQALKEQIPSISHRSKTFQSIYKETIDNLRELFQLGDDQHILFTSSATEVWERIVQNLIERESYHFVNGAFSRRFSDTVSQLNRNPLCQEVNEGDSVNIEKLLIPESTELIAITANETSTGASQPAEDIYELRKSFPDQLIALDVVSAAPAYELDYSKIDTAYFSVQKCFGLPAGLGVWIVNNRCLEKTRKLLDKGHSIGSYHSLPVLMEKAIKNQTPETPNVLSIYLLGKVAGDMLTKDLDQIRRETKYKAAVLYQAFEQSSYLKPFVSQDKYRSLTTPVAETSVDSSKIIESFEKSGIILGGGYGKFKNQHIRIANFPTHSKEHVEMIADKLAELKI